MTDVFRAKRKGKKREATRSVIISYVIKDSAEEQPCFLLLLPNWLKLLLVRGHKSEERYQQHTKAVQGFFHWSPAEVLTPLQRRKDK